VKFTEKKKLLKSKKLGSVLNIKGLGCLNFEVNKKLKSASKFCAEICEI